MSEIKNRQTIISMSYAVENIRKPNKKMMVVEADSR